jgi:hypothetical protein
VDPLLLPDVDPLLPPLLEVPPLPLPLPDAPLLPLPLVLPPLVLPLLPLVLPPLLESGVIAPLPAHANSAHTPVITNKVGARRAAARKIEWLISTNSLLRSSRDYRSGIRRQCEWKFKSYID